MKFFIYCITIIMLLLCSHMSTAFSKQSEIFINKESIEAFFYVAGKKINVFWGDMNTSKVDNKFIVNAFKKEPLNIQKLNYDVILKKSDIEYSIQDENRKISIFQYIITFDACTTNNKLLKKYIDKVKTTGYKKIKVSNYKYPVTCYLFSTRRKLILLGHYGLSTYHKNLNPKDIIDLIKKKIELNK